MNITNKIKVELDWFYRKITSKNRVLPNCLIVGAQKAGTSSLYHFLTQHPQIHSPLQKEVHYFSGGYKSNTDNYAKKENWYRAHFPLQSAIKQREISLEATPMYLFHPLAAQRIKTLIPNCKIIILLRDPVERAISHYFHVKRHSFENLPIEQAMQSENQRLQPALSTNNYSDPAFRLYSYQARGLYLEQIKRFQSCFSPEQVLILSSEELMSDSSEVLQNVFSFLDVDCQQKIDDLHFKNQGSNKQSISNQVYTQLSEYFYEPNTQLFKHLNRSFDWR